MKKNLLILTALLVLSPLARADWGPAGSSWEGHYYTNAAEIDSVTTVESTSTGATSYIQRGDVTTSTINTLTVDDGDTLIVAKNTADNVHDLHLTAGTLNLGENATIQVNADQELIINSISMGTGSSLIVDAGATATLNAVSGGTTLTSIAVNGTLNLSSSVNLHSSAFTLGTSGSLGGVLNFGQADKASLTIRLDAKDAVLGGGYVQQLTSGEVWNVQHLSEVNITMVDTDDYANGGMVYRSGGKYYSTATHVDNGDIWTVSDEITLQDNTLYLVADVSGSATLFAVLVPEPATATLSLLALAGLVARRRRK